MRAVIIAISLAALAAVGSPAAVQTRGAEQRAPARIPVNARDDDQAEAHRVISAYARCVAARNRPGVLAFLELPPSSSRSGSRAARLATADCLYEGELRFNASLFRGQLFEALYRQDYNSLPLPDLSSTPPLPPLFPPDAELNDRQRVAMALSAFAECAVRADPAAARRLTLSQVASAAENEAFAALSQTFSGCLSQGIQLSFSRPMLRGIVAESLYRLSTAALPLAPAPS